MADARTPSIDVEAGNAVAPPRSGTQIGVSGHGFEALSEVKIEVFLGRHNVIWPVDAEGGFSWGEIVRPQLAGGSPVDVIVTASDGTKLEAVAEVFAVDAGAPQA